MSRMLSSENARYVRHVLLQLKDQWEAQFEQNGYSLEIDGELVPVTPELLETVDYGRILMALADLDGIEDWREKLPNTIRSREVNRI